MIMGAWGCGMQANDDALDWIEEKQDCAKTIQRIKQAYKGTNYPQHRRWAILGVIDAALDNKTALLPLVIEIGRAAAKSELKYNCFKNQPERAAALNRFLDRLSNKKVDEAELTMDNLGLFDQLALKMNNISRKRAVKMLKTTKRRKYERSR